MAVAARILILGVGLTGLLLATGCSVSGGFTIGPIYSGSSGGGSSSSPSGSTTTSGTSSGSVGLVRSVALPSFDGIGADGEREGTLLAGSEKSGKTVQLLSGMTLEKIMELVESVHWRLVYQPDRSKGGYDVYLLEPDVTASLPTGAYIYFKDGVMIGFLRDNSFP